MKYSELKQEIETEFSETVEIDGVYKPVQFDAAFSHDIVKKKLLDKELLISEVNRKPKEQKPIDNRFLSKRMREIVFVPMIKK